jgi:putative flippase GtrA
VFVLMVQFGIAPVVATGSCYVLGMILSYLVNRRWTFDSTAGHGRDLPKFLLSHGVGFVSALGFILLLTRWMRPEIAQILNIGLTAMVIYLVLRLTRFGFAKVQDAD